MNVDMQDSSVHRTQSGGVFALLCCFALALTAQAQEPEHVFHDSHFHLTNYIQKGTDIHDYLKIMGDTVGRSTLFGIPLQQTWS